MEMNVTNAARYETAKANEGYGIDKDFVTQIKEQAAEAAKTNTGRPSKEFLEQQAAIFERPEVKSFLGKYNYESLNELGSRRLDEQLKKDGYMVGWSSYSSEFESMSSKEKLDVYKEAYVKMYDEIERGYADGTRSKNVLDLKLPGDDMYDKIRPLTKEEELDALTKAYEYKAKSLTGKMKQELDNELVKQGKIKLYREPTNKKNQNVISAYEAQKVQLPKAPVDEEIEQFAKDVTFKSPEELEQKKMEFINMITKNAFDITTLLPKQYNQSQPGTFDVAAFLSTVSQK